VRRQRGRRVRGVAEHSCGAVTIFFRNYGAQRRVNIGVDKRALWASRPVNGPSIRMDGRPGQSITIFLHCFRFHTHEGTTFTHTLERSFQPSTTRLCQEKYSKNMWKPFELSKEQNILCNQRHSTVKRMKVKVGIASSDHLPIL
jgi:hypothetical protein